MKQLLIILFTLLCFSQARANYYSGRLLSVKEKVEHADVVLIGKVLQVKTHLLEESRVYVVREFIVAATSIYKGDTRKRLLHIYSPAQVGYGIKLKKGKRYIIYAAIQEKYEPLPFIPTPTYLYTGSQTGGCVLINNKEIAAIEKVATIKKRWYD